MKNRANEIVEFKRNKSGSRVVVTRRALVPAEIERANKLDSRMWRYKISARQLAEKIGRSKATIDSYRTKRRPIPAKVWQEIEAALKELKNANGHARE